MGLIAKTDFWTELARGNVKGGSCFHKFGAIAAVGTVYQVISSSGLYQTPAVLTSLEMHSSDNVNDVAGGNGIRSVDIIGISNQHGLWTEETQTVALNGTTAVPVPNQQWRNYRLQAATAGVYGSPTVPSHNSIITLRVAGGGATWSTITQEGTYGQGQSEIGAFTVPKGKGGWLLIKHISVEGNKNVDIVMCVRPNADTVAAPFSVVRIIELDRQAAGKVPIEFVAPKFIGNGPTDIWFMGKTQAGNSDVAIDFEIGLFDV